MRVLLTGGPGFLGSHVAELLVEAGHDVRATVRRTSDTRWIDPLALDTVVANLEDAGALEEALSGIEAVVHVGGVTIAADPAVYERVNAEGTRLLAAAAGAAGVRRFVLVSSLAARGPDGADGPVSPYGHSKRGGERWLAELAAEGRAPAAIRVVRPGGIYGPRDDDLLSLFRMATRGLLVLPASHNTLQPVHVHDVARSVMRALEAADPDAGAPDPGPLPVLGAERVSWGDVGAALEAAVGRTTRILRVPPRVFLVAGGIAELGAKTTGEAPTFDRRRARDLTRRSYTADLSPTEGAIGWSPRVGLREGMAGTVAWYREQGWLER